MQEQFIGCVVMVQVCMLGEYLCIATLHKVKYPLVKSFHFITHRLEVAVKNSVDDVNVVSQFRSFVDALYKVNSLSTQKKSKV